MDDSEINSINTELEVLQNMNSCSQRNIVDIVDKINTVFLTSAKQTFGVAKITKRRRKCTQRTWFDAECKRKRNEYHIARKHYIKMKNEITKTVLKQSSKEYKHTLSKHYNKHRKDMISYSSLNNPKLFWKILNDDVDKTLDFSNDISVDTFLEFLENMNYSKQDDGSDFSQYFVTDLETYGLNDPITPEEILQCFNN